MKVPVEPQLEVTGIALPRLRRLNAMLTTRGCGRPPRLAYPCARFLAWRVVVASLGLHFAIAAEAGDSARPPRVNVVFYTPAEIDPPPGVQERLTAVANYTEKFFASWLSEWGYAPRQQQIFDRSVNGKLRVLYLRGRSSANVALPDPRSIADEVVRSPVLRRETVGASEIWWVWVYLGDPPTRFADYRGFGNVSDGGVAVVNYSTEHGQILDDDDLAEGFNAQFTLKGCMHELGHAFGLFHIGPTKQSDLGIPLMGANIPDYRATTDTEETRVYLSAACAAMLWKHPIFSGVAKERGRMPRVETEGVEALAQPETRTILVRGRVRADLRAHSALVADDAPPMQLEYWRKAYTARVATDGSFKVNVDEPSADTGDLRLIFCFENGIVSGDGRRHGLDGAIRFSYKHVRGNLEILAR